MRDFTKQEKLKNEEESYKTKLQSSSSFLPMAELVDLHA